MLFDFNEAWPRVKETQYDVCVCGTGPAGITTARRLAARGKRVLLLEGGGLSHSSLSQDHYRGESAGRTFWLEFSRLRYFGGTSNHWSGLCTLFQPGTFEVHANHLGLPGWPISYEEVHRCIDEAKEILDVAGKDLTQAEQPGFTSPWFDRFGHALSPPTRFSEKYGAEIRQSRQIEAFYNANLVDLKLSDDLTRVQYLRIRNYNSIITDISAAQYVFALGGIENARILLNVNKQVPAGIGNHSGMVGRCFMESLNVPIGRFLVTDPTFWQVSSIPLVPTEALMRQSYVGDGVIDFGPNVSALDLKSSGRLRVLKDFLRETGCFSPTVTAMARRIVDFDCPGDGVISSLIEQEPNPNSRVTLTNDVDSFGLRRVQMDWQLNDRDLKTIRVLAIEAAKEMARLNRARVQLAPFILDPDIEIPVHGHGHHMGTTRMSADPRYGVVDENCRIHGIENLYLAGSSVFPNCGGRNPTLTIVLLALRLGDFLSRAR
jgi:choline dehydrogenase-like flavoprotein